MLIKTTDNAFDKLFGMLKQDASQAGITVLIFVAYDCDAIAACHIFTSLLRAEFIKYNIVCVDGYDDLQASFKSEATANPELRSLVLLNCGGNIDLFELFALDNNPNLTIYVADSHRPYFPDNIENKQQILLLDDGSGDMIDDLQSGRSEDDEENALMSGDEDISMEDADGDDGVVHWSRSEFDEDDEDDGEADEADEALEDEDEGSDEVKDEQKRGKKRAAEKSKKGRKPKRQKQENAEIEELEEEDVTTKRSEITFYGFSTAALVYTLAKDLNAANNSLLWLAVLGLTDQYIHERIDSSRYQREYKLLEREVLNMNPSNEERGREQLQAGQIEPSKEFRFYMYRHWNLYDSMYHSRFVAVKLGIWKAHGQQQLEVLLAKMGIPKSECQQPYSAMQKQYKELLAQQLSTYGKQFHLGDVMVNSFLTRRGSLVVSASDVVTSITALLESAMPDKDVQDASLLAQQLQKARQRHFWMAYDALTATSSAAEDLSLMSNKAQTPDELLRRGVDAAISQQRALVRQALSIVQKKFAQETVQAGPLRYVLLHDSPDLRHFMHPVALTKLAHFLVDTLIEMGQSKKVKPFVVGALREATGTFVIVGLPGSHSGAVSKPNKVGIWFKKAAEFTGARLTANNFATNVVEVHRNDVANFFDYLRHSSEDY